MRKTVFQDVENLINMFQKIYSYIQAFYTKLLVCELTNWVSKKIINFKYTFMIRVLHAINCYDEQ